MKEEKPKIASLKDNPESQKPKKWIKIDLKRIPLLSFEHFITTSTKNTFTNLHIAVRPLDGEPRPVMWASREDFITSK